MEKKSQIDREKLPRHIAVIMDGNGRWAKRQGHARVFGHKHGVTAVRETVEAAAELGIQYLTLYAFSTENWNRPKLEVDALMELLVRTIKNEVKTLMKNDIRLAVIGKTDMLPDRSRNKLAEAMEATKHNKRMTLVLALSYSSKWEITEAIRAIAAQAKDGKLDPAGITEQTVTDALGTKGMPDPELMIRTSGEQRISNFLLWQLAYAELYFTETLWPDFRKDDLYDAIIDYQQRERRFGKTSEQIKPITN